MEPGPSMLDVNVTIPVDGTFAEMAEMLDTLAERHTAVTATRSNPRYQAAGGMMVNPNDLAFMIAAMLGGGGLIAFAKRFFEHLADDTYDALKRQIGEYRERRRAREAKDRWNVHLLVHRLDEDSVAAVSFRWDSDDDWQQLAAAALDLSESPDQANTFYAWDPEAGQWFEFELGTGRPIGERGAANDE